MTRHFFREIIPQNNCTIEDIKTVFRQDIQYASMGRYGIYHILKALNTENKKVMMPVYACKSVADAIRKAGFVPVYYDIAKEDLNGDLEDIKRCHNETKSRILILPSLYGNPADLSLAEDYCNKNDIIMIDDAAQCFGARCNGRTVGTFGNAGLFSYSAGKLTYGHMGCFFWSDFPVTIHRTRHYILHGLKYINYFFNRYGDYNAKKLYRLKLFNYFIIFLGKIFRIENDDICKFEEKLLAEIAYDNIFRLKEKRTQYMESAIGLFHNSDFRVVVAQRGEPNNNKLVLVANTVQAANLFINILQKNNVYCSKGYKLLDDSGNTPVAQSLYEKVIEIPILISDYENRCDITNIQNSLEEYNRQEE